MSWEPSDADRATASAASPNSVMVIKRKIMLDLRAHKSGIKAVLTED